MEKIKEFYESNKGKDILTVVIVILVGLGSFGLGRLSKNNNKSAIKIEYPTQDANALLSIDDNQNMTNYSSNKVIKGNTTSIFNNTSNKNFFASKKGRKYYSLGCGAGKTIKQENRIYFSTSSKAEKAGYILSTSCN